MRGAGDYRIHDCPLSVCPSVRPSVCQHLVGGLVSVADLKNYCTDSNEILHTYRRETLVVHLGIGFDDRQKMALWDFVKNRHFFRLLI